MASVDTIWNLIKKHKLSFPDISKKSDVRSKFHISSLEEFIDLFINVIQNCFKTIADLEMLLDDARDYLLRNNIVYSEIFFAPTKFIFNGFDFKEMIAVLDQASVSFKKKNNILVRFLIDVSRTNGSENAMNNLNLTLKYKTDSIIGIGLGGSEEKGPAKDYAKVFQKAKKSGLLVVAHAGEVIGPESVWDAIKLLKAQRIGHGISSMFDESLMDYLRDQRIPLEICPTSNIFTRKYVTRIEQHPIRLFFDRGILVTVNTDDPTIFGVDLVDEYYTLYKNNIFTFDEILQLLKNNIDATFLPDNEKKKLMTRVEKVLQAAPVSAT
ncbi:MAG: adenosine deaminase [Spirochaetales bacterium]|nr:MAG: adenosine deaminase [Spirochaetales bacterium]